MERHVAYRILPDGSGVERIVTTTHTECAHGHRYTPENVRIRQSPQGDRLVCWECEQHRSRKSYEGRYNRSVHGSIHRTATGAISTGPDGFWECACGKRYKSRQGFRRHMERG